MIFKNDLPAGDEETVSTADIWIIPRTPEQVRGEKTLYEMLALRGRRAYNGKTKRVRLLVMTTDPNSTKGQSTTHEVELGTRTPFDKEVPLGAIDSSKPKPILLNVESGVKGIISAIAKNEKIEGIDISPEDFAKLPNSQTGVVMHFIVKGLKEEFGITFNEVPTSLKVRGTSNRFDQKVQGKKRLLTREQKNEILARMQMSYYEKDMATGNMSMDDVMDSMKEAFNTKKEFEEMGYMLPPAKTAYPFWKEEEEQQD